MAVKVPKIANSLMPTIGVVVPFYNNDDDISTCLQSLKCSDYIIDKIVIVNNSDRPTNIEIIAKEYKNVEVIKAKPRIGFARANNIGADVIVKLGIEYIITLNQDTIISRSCFSELLKPFLISKDVMIAAPVLYDYALLSIESFFIRWYLTQCPTLFYDALRANIQLAYDVKYVSGACLGIRSSFIQKFGFFDPIYFMYCEDEDLCRKVEQLGYRIVLVPKAKVGHNHSHTNGDEKQRRTISLWKRKSDAIFMLKNTEAPIFIALFKIIQNHIRSYFSLLIRFRLRYFFETFISDTEFYFDLPSILRSRCRKKILVKESIGSQL